MRLATLCCVFFGLTCLSTLVRSAPLPIIQVKNSKLFVNNVEYSVKGVNYVPEPLGQQGMSNGYGGTGLCSAKLTPWSEWKSACYDSDYYDGSPDINPSRFPNGMKPLWERDLPTIKSLGANTIRLYNTNPSTRAATQEYTNLFAFPTGKDHTQFIKYCEQVGLMVIYPLFSDEGSYNTYDEYTFKRYLRWQIDEVGNSSSILMWQFGNEMGWSWYSSNNPNWNSPTATAKFNRYLTYIRKYTLSKWGRFIPVTTAIPNFHEQYNYQYQNWHVDIFSANVFFNNYDFLFQGNNDNFAGVTALSCMYNKPFLMTEVGPTWASGVPYVQGAFNEIWANVLKNMVNGGLIGAVWFEFTDEPALGKDFGLFSFQQNVLSSGVSSTSPDGFIADTLVTKPQYYDAVQGSYNGQPYNMRTDMFALLGRAPTFFNNVTDRCGGYYSCPGSSYPKCSGNGICDRTQGTCTCAPGWTGSTCATASCPKSSGGVTCSGRGVCSSLTTPPECACSFGYFGSACEQTVSSVAAGKCPNGCSQGSGTCNITSTGTWTCFCHKGWTGVDCSVHDFGYGSVNIQQNYFGCLRAPNFTVTAPSSSSVTNQECRYYCAMRNYAYAGTSGGNKCFCGNSYASSSTSTCSYPCTGDAKQYCGGSTQVSTYYTYNSNGAGYIGCFIDDGNRDLPMLIDTGSPLTVDNCRSACSNAGYAYAGMQNSNQCWCGNSFGNTGGKAPESDCAMSCVGDSTLKCGAGWRNSVYTASLPTGYAYYN